MNIKKVAIPLILILLLIPLNACSKKSNAADIYTGKPLKIGVIGEFPDVNESKVSFISIDFNDLLSEDEIQKLDAVIIMKKHLQEASNSKYANVYQNSEKPFFFIESTKSYLPFVDENTRYDDAIDVNSGSYATGYINVDGKHTYWGYGLYDDQVNKKNIRDAYSRIFKTIEEYSN